MGSLGHMILDAFQGVLGVSLGAGARVDAAAACKAACGDKELADVTEELLAAQLKRYQAVGFKELIVGCFSEPSTLLLPIVRAACSKVRAAPERRAQGASLTPPPCFLRPASS